MTSRPPKIRQEVDSQVEHYGGADFIRQIAYHRGDGFGEGMVEGVSRMLLHDGPLRVERQDLECT